MSSHLFMPWHSLLGAVLIGLALWCFLGICVALIFGWL